MRVTVDVSEREGAGGRLAQVVRIAGELDNATAPEASRALAPVVADPFPHVILNLADLAYVSSAGVAVLLDTRKRLEAKKTTVAAIGMRPSIRKVFEIMQSLPASSVFATVAELDEYLAAIQERAREARP
jgi:anti-anti-sigma factor